jgi:hypothetical protein
MRIFRSALILAAWSGLAAAGCDTMTPARGAYDDLTPGDAEARRRAVAVTTARRDFNCKETKVVVALRPSAGDEWHPLLEPLTGRPRYVVEGCGQRGLYVESCEFLPNATVVDADLPMAPAPATRSYECRYLLVSAVPSHAHGANASVQKPSATPATVTAVPVDTEGATATDAVGM